MNFWQKQKDETWLCMEFMTSFDLKSAGEALESEPKENLQRLAEKLGKMFLADLVLRNIDRFPFLYTKCEHLTSNGDTDTSGNSGNILFSDQDHCEPISIDTTLTVPLRLDSYANQMGHFLQTIVSTVDISPPDNENQTNTIIEGEKNCFNKIVSWIYRNVPWFSSSHFERNDFNLAFISGIRIGIIALYEQRASILSDSGNLEAGEVVNGYLQSIFGENGEIANVHSGLRQ